MYSQIGRHVILIAVIAWAAPAMLHWLGAACHDVHAAGLAAL
jgi:hypothetical protein